MFALANRLRRILYLRYIGVSAISLGVDMLSFSLLLIAAIPPASASALGYSMGILVHWLLSSRKVFVDGVALSGRRRARQKAMFIASALLGLGVTVAIVWVGDNAGMAPLFAKAIAVGVSFQLTYMLRKSIVFAG